MFGKRKILVIGIAGAASFAAMMAFSMLGGKPSPTRGADANGRRAGAGETLETAEVDTSRFTPKERQLDELIRQVQGKMVECQQREEALTEREGRIALTQDLLKKQTKDLDNQLVTLLARQAGLSQEQEKLEKSRIRIAQEEKANLKKTAQIYEKMDAASGGRILLGLCEGQQIDDAVKILYYMGDRSAAKLLAEINDKALAAQLTELLKRIREEG